MKINELKPMSKSVNLEADVVSVSPAREIPRPDRTLRVADAILKDDTGEVTLTLWNDEIEKVQAGMKIRIENGYVNMYKEKMQLTAGKFGKITIL